MTATFIYCAFFLFLFFLTRLKFYAALYFIFDISGIFFNVLFFKFKITEQFISIYVFETFHVHHKSNQV